MNDERGCTTERVSYLDFSNSVGKKCCSSTNRRTIIDILRFVVHTVYQDVPARIWTVEFVERDVKKVEDSGLTRQKMVWSCQNHARPCVTLKPFYVVLSTGRGMYPANNEFIIHTMRNCPILVVVRNHQEAWLQDSRIIIRGRGCTQHSVARRVVRLQYRAQLCARALRARILTAKILSQQGFSFWDDFHYLHLHWHKLAIKFLYVSHFSFFFYCNNATIDRS